MSAIKLPELPLPDTYVWGVDEPTVYSAEALVAYAEQAVREALAAQVAKINEAVASMSTYEVTASAIRKEYFKAGARRVIQAINSALIPEKDHG